MVWHSLLFEFFVLTISSQTLIVPSTLQIIRKYSFQCSPVLKALIPISTKLEENVFEECLKQSQDNIKRVNACECGYACDGSCEMILK